MEPPHFNWQLTRSGHNFDFEDVTILDREDKWHERGVKEAIWERVDQPSLNKTGELRFQLSHTWDRALQDIPSRLQVLLDPNQSGSVAS